MSGKSFENRIREVESTRQFPNWLDDKRFPRILTFEQFKLLQTLHAQKLAESLFEQLKADWMSGYKYYMNCDYSWDKPDNKALGILIHKIGNYYKDHSTGIRELYRDYIKFCFKDAPKWYRDNLELKLVNSKFNILIKLYEEQTIKREKRMFDPNVKLNDASSMKTLAEIIPNIPVKVNQDNK